MTVCLRQAVFVPPSVCVVADELGIHADGGDLRIVAQVESTTPLELVARPSVTGVQGQRGAVPGVDAVNNGFAVVLRHLLARVVYRPPTTRCCRWVGCVSGGR